MNLYTKYISMRRVTITRLGTVGAVLDRPPDCTEFTNNILQNFKYRGVNKVDESIGVSFYTEEQ